MPINLPKKCLRNRDDCQPLAQIESDDKVSFVCCGENDLSSRNVIMDRFRLCWKNNQVDEIGDYDRRDLIDTASVIMQALSVDINKNNVDEINMAMLDSVKWQPHNKRWLVSNSKAWGKTVAKLLDIFGLKKYKKVNDLYLSKKK